MIKATIYLFVFLFVPLCRLHAQVDSKTLVSAVNNGPANGSSSCPAVSGDGRFTVFESDASDLVSGDNNNRSDLFLFDAQNKSLSIVSKSGGVLQQGGETIVTCNAGISRDGSTIVYASSGIGLVAGVETNIYRIYAIDVASGQIELLVPANLTVGAFFPTVSEDGSKVVFVSDDPAFPGANGKSQVYLLNRATDEISLLSKDAQSAAANDSTFRAVLSADGKWVAYESTASNLAGSTVPASFATPQIFLMNIDSGQHGLVSKNAQGIIANASASQPSIAADGSKVVFFSEANNLSDQDRNRDSDIFLFDNNTDPGSIELISVTSAGKQIRGFNELFTHSLSADGNRVMFRSLEKGREKFGFEVYVRDRAAQQTYLATFSNRCGSKKDREDLNSGSIAPDAPLVALSSGRDFPKAPLQLFLLGIDTLEAIAAAPQALDKIDTDVCKDSATLVFSPFAPDTEAAAAKVTYETRLREAGESTIRRLTNKKNVLTLSNLSPGRYDASYRLKIVGSDGSVSRSPFGGSTSFRVK